MKDLNVKNVILLIWNYNFKYYWYPGLQNICKECQNDFKFDQHDLIDLESIIIDDKKLNEIITKINPNKQININADSTDLNNNGIIETNKLEPIDDNIFEIVTEEEKMNLIN